MWRVDGDTGGPVDTLRYDAFGKVVSESNAAQGDRYKFTGREYESAFGAYYYRARFYDPSAGRFYSEDPAGFAANDPNLYRYAGNSGPNLKDPSGHDPFEWLVNQFGGADAVLGWDEYLGNYHTGWFAQTSNFAAGMGDAVSFGLTAEIRNGLGYDDVVDKTSDAYRYGGYAGQAVSIALMAVTPVGWAKVAARGLNMVTTLGGGVQAAKAAAEGDFEAAGKLLVQTAVGRLAGRGAPCNAFTQAGKRAQKALWAANTVEQSSGAVEKLASGDIIGGLLDLAQAGVSARRMLQSCFAAGTPLLVPGGSKAIEAFVAGDLVLSRDESSPGGRVEAKVVEEVFSRTGQIIHLHVGGQLIGTTGEHPFYAYDRGWVRAADLAAGDRLLSHDGRWTMVEEVFDTGGYATLYNLRVADWHTYFVGSAEWGWSAWAHNADYGAGRGPVTSRHYSESSTGRRLQQEARAFRAAHAGGANPNRNFATADVTVNGVNKTVRFVNDPHGMHSEQRLVAWHEAMIGRGKTVQVKAVFSERPPCGDLSANCANTLGNRYGQHLDVWHGDL